MIFLLRSISTAFLCCFCMIGVAQDSIESRNLQHIQIVDELGGPTPARIRVTDLNGKYYAPVGHATDFPITFSADQEAIEKDVMLANNRRFAYTDGDFKIQLPAGINYRIEIVKGHRYQMINDTFEVNSNSLKTFSLRKKFDLPDQGWYSGDVHVHHISPTSAYLETKAEDLNVCNILISDFTKDHHLFRGSIEPNSDSFHQIFLGQEYREDKLGHINLLNIEESLIKPAKAMRPHQYPLNIDVVDEVRTQNGHVSWAHFAAWPGLEGPLALILKKVDAVELLCTIDPFQSPIFASYVVPDLPLNSGLQLWYRLLNCGLRVPITAGTDKMGNLVTVGSNRVYAFLDGPLDYAAWTKALTAGKTFVSNSPYIQFEVDGKIAGDDLQLEHGDSVQVLARVWSQFPIDHLDIVANGHTIASTAIAAGKEYAELTITLKVEESSWLAARAYRDVTDYQRQGIGLSERRNMSKQQTLLNDYFGTLRPESPFAHTSPIYLSIDEESVYNKVDVDYFVRYLNNVMSWLETDGSFPSEAAKREVLDKFAEGRQTFESLHRR